MSIESKMNDPEFRKELPISREEAKQQSKSHYYSRPCKYGHVSYHRTVNGQCCMCAAAATRKVMKAMPPEKLKQMQKKANDKWNNSEQGKSKKQEWKERDPKRTWVIDAVNRAKKRSITKKIPFSIDVDYVLSITPDVCPVFGTTFVFTGGGRDAMKNASLDKIKPELGYVVGNIAVISARANVIKNDATPEEILKVYDWVKTVAL
jgi:hypothetical protein